MSIFDFIRGKPLYAHNERSVDRLNTRHRFVISPFLDEIRGARILDLASHDGRWPYAFAQAGAREVIGIEGRAELIEQFETFPDDAAKARVELRQGDINVEVPKLVETGERFDVIGVLGIFYHITTHYVLLSQLSQLRPNLILIDSEFLNRPLEIIQLVPEDPRRHMNTLQQLPNQTKTLKGVPSRTATEMMARNLGYRVDWLDWDALPEDERQGVKDYYRKGRMTRGTCALRPED